MAKFYELTLNAGPSGGMYEGHCVNHPECRYLTKGPGRSLFFNPVSPLTPECDCPMTDIEFETSEPLLHTNPWDVAR